jgi:hypothetical protein
MRLYRGLEKKFNKEHDLSTTDAPSGYSTWTNNKELARQYAGVNGFVYSLDLDDEFETEEMLDMDGDRGLFLNNQKKAGLNGVSGDEYLVYTHHEEFNPNDIKLVTESKRNPLNEGFASDFMKAIKKPFKKVVYTLDNTEPLSKDQDFKIVQLVKVMKKYLYDIGSNKDPLNYIFKEFENDYFFKGFGEWLRDEDYAEDSPLWLDIVDTLEELIVQAKIANYGHNVSKESFRSYNDKIVFIK